jgi:hypothetical protein
VLLLEKVCSFELRPRSVTLAEELSVRHVRWTGAITLSRLGLLSGAAQIASFVCCCEYTQPIGVMWTTPQGIQGAGHISFIIQPCLLGIISLLVSSIIFNIALRSRFHAGGTGHTTTTFQSTPFKSIRDLLLEGRTSVSAELIHNLVPKRM